MNSKAKNIELKFQQLLSDLRKSLFPKQEGEVWLYGSRARGDNRNDSDWDLIVVTDSFVDNYANFKKFAFPFIQLGIEYGQDVIPLLYSRDEWQRQSNTLFYENVVKDRICL